MKINRRNALATATALTLGTLGVPVAARSKTPPSSRADSSFDRQDVTGPAAECSAACSACLNIYDRPLTTGKNHLKAILAECRDCGDICGVIASLRGRRGAVAPAIHQACADSCARLVKMIGDETRSPQIDLCRQAATRCIVACLRSIGDSELR